MINKKVPLNPRYADVKSVVDHGKSMKNVDVQQDSLIAKKKGENFGRILAKTLARFLSESNNEESVIGLIHQSKDNEDKENKNFDVMSVASGKSESIKSSVTTQANQFIGKQEETKFILLDLREEEEYAKFHIREAINFPAPNISRDKTFGQLLRFKNQSDKIIVVYMEDERLGTQYAKILFEKGFDNICLLSGGVEKFMDSGIDCYSMIEGANIPAQPKPAKMARPSSAASSKRSLAGGQSVMNASHSSMMTKNSQGVSTLSRASLSSAQNPYRGIGMRK